jgi:transcription antitermination factor NusG
MKSKKKKGIGGLAILLAIAAGIYYFLKKKSQTSPQPGTKFKVGDVVRVIGGEAWGSEIYEIESIQSNNSRYVMWISSQPGVMTDLLFSDEYKYEIWSGS